MLNRALDVEALLSFCKTQQFLSEMPFKEERERVQQARIAKLKIF